MIDAVRFVANAAPRKAFDPELLFFRIHDGRIWSFNGSVSLSAPIDLEGTLYPHSVDLLKAAGACVSMDDPITIEMDEPNQLLYLRCGRFTAKIRCSLDAATKDNAERYLPPKGEAVAIRTNLLDVCRTLEPFIGEDASRPWACGLYFRDHSVFATNNIIVVEHWLKAAFPFPINVPSEAVGELIRLGESPTRMQIDSDRVTFFFSEGRWMTALLLSLEWPDVSRILDEAMVGSQMEPIPLGLFEDVEKLLPFADPVCHQVWFGEGRVTVKEEAAVLDNPRLPAAGSYNGKQLGLIKKVASAADFDLYPRPLPFIGKGIRGMIAGMR